MSVTVVAPKVVLNQGPEELVTQPPDLVLDVRGLICPFTSLKTVQGLGMLNAGQTLEVITSDESSALESIPAALRRRSLPFAVLDDGNGAWVIRVRKTSPTPAK